MSNQQYEFLKELWGENPGRSRYIQLWSRDSKTTHYFATAGTAAKYATEHPRDLYVGVSLASKNYGPKRRAPASDSAGLAGLWADIDINGGPEGKVGAAPDMETATQLAFSVITPTLVISSGYGLQCWWLFEGGPWRLLTPEDRELAARMAAGWIALHRAKAEEMGFGLDGTQDLARVLRIPGTVNCKGSGDPEWGDAPVEHLWTPDEWEGERHPREYLAELALEAKPQATAVREALQGLVGDFEVSPNAELPFSKMQAALANSPNFRKTWEHTRKDRAAADWTTSEYDLSLASFAANMGWTDQEIANLIIVHRRDHGDAEKALRPDYLRNTIARARRSQKEDERAAKAEGHLENLTAMAEVGSTDEVAIMAEFNGVIDSERLKVKELIQDGDDPRTARFRLVIEPGGREVPIGPASVLFSPDAFREAFAVVTGHIVMPVKRDKWLTALQALLNVRQVHVAPDDTPAGQVLEWLGQYLSERLLTDQSEAARRREPFEKDHHVFVYAGSFCTFVNRSLGRRVGEPDLKQMLKAAGFATKTVSFEREDGKGTSRSYYCAPREVVE